MTHKLNRFTALMLAVIMTFSVLLVPVEASSFRDVVDNAWYAEAVEYVHEKGFMAGVSENTFAPATNVTRGMMVTVLARLVGGETDNDAAIFADTAPGKWYTGPASWGALNGIVAGVGDSKFAPNHAITRQDLCLMLYKYIKAMGIELENTIDRTFSDMDSVAEYAREAVIYCTGTGLISGFEDSSFRPKDTATRAQLAQILMRLDLLVEGQKVEFMPAQSFESEAGEDMSVSVSAPVGALPESTEMTVSRINDEAYLAALAKQAGVKSVVAAADITFTKDGVELEPDKAVEVQFSLEGLEDLENPTVLHVRDDGILEYVSSELISTTRGGAKALRFQAKDFSVYIIGEDLVELLTVTFYEPDGNGWKVINKQTIRKDQIANGLLENPVFDPGVPSLTDAQSFEGWAESSTITSSTVGKTVDQINDYVKANYNSIGVDDDTHNNGLKYYAIVRDVAFISFRDQDGVVFRTVSVPLTNGVGSYTLNLSYTPYSGDWAHLGWSTAISNTGEEPTYPENAVIYDKGETITLSSNLDLYPYLKQGHWVVFDNYIGQDSDPTSASYTQPLYFSNDEVTKEPTDYGDSNYDGVDHDPTPYREGYTFGGWYTCTKDAEGKVTSDFSTLYTWDQYLTEDVTVAAKWIANSGTPYTVIIWTQRASDEADLADADKTYDFYKAIETRTGTTNGMANFTTADTRYGDYSSGIGELGFYYTYNASNSDTAGVRIKGDGSTVVNVKYDRKEITVNFHGSLSSYTYDSASGYWNIHYAHYGRVDGKYVYLKLASTSSSYPNSDGDIRTSNARWTVATTGETYTGTIYRVSTSTSSSSTFLTYKGLYGSTLVGWPGSDPGYRWAYTSSQEYGMSIPIDAYIPWYETLTWNIYRQNPDSTNSRTQYYYGQDENGRYPTSEDEYMAVGHVYWAAGGSSNLYLYDTLFLGYKRDYWRNGSFTASNTDISHDSGSTTISGSSMSTNGIYIFYKRNQWNLTFFSNGEELTDLNATVYYNHKLSDYKPTADPTNGPVGYYFDGWYKDPNGEEPFDWSANMPDNNMAVYAKWSKIRYRVIIDVTGGDPTAEVELPEGQATAFRVWYGEKVLSGALDQATREGYKLVGWYYDQNGNQPFNFDAAIVEETPTLDKTYADDLTDTSVRSGYDPYAEEGNKNWDDTPEEQWNVRAKLVIYALWRVEPVGSDGVRVRYDAIEDDGYFAPDEEVYIRDDPNIYTDRAKAFAQPASTAIDDEYQFLYWVVMEPEKDGDGNVILDDDRNPVLKETTVKVYPGQTFDVGYDYTVRTEAYKITWVYKTPNGTDRSDTVTVTAGTVPSRPDPSGYVSNGQYFPFDHWTPTIVAATQNATYTAVYGEGQALTQTFTVTWKNWNGITLAEQTYTVGDTPSYPNAAPTRPDDEEYTYTFAGWTPEITVVAEDVTYTAVYDQALIPYDVVFNANGGSFSGSSTTTVTGVTKGTVYRDIFPATNPTNSNSSRYFLGWFTAATGGTQINDTDEFDATVTTLYAHWYTESWDTTTSLEGGNSYVFVYNNKAITYNGSGSNLSPTSYTANNPNLNQIWYAQTDSYYTSYCYLMSLGGYTNDGVKAYMYSSSTSGDSPMVASTDYGSSLMISGSTLKYANNVYVYLNNNKYYLSSSSTSFTVYKYNYTDLNAGSKGVHNSGETNSRFGSTLSSIPVQSQLSGSKEVVSEKSRISETPAGADDTVVSEAPAAVDALPEPRTDAAGEHPDSVTPPVIVSDPAAGLKRVLMREPFSNGSITEVSQDTNISSSTTWSAYKVGSANNWSLYTYSSDTQYSYAGSYAAMYEYNKNYDADCYLISAPIPVSENATALDVSLYERVTADWYTTYPEKFEVFVVKADNYNTPYAIVNNATHYSAIASATYTNTSYAKQTGSVSNVSALVGEDVRIVIHCTSDANMYKLYIDDIIVTETTTEEAVTYEPVDYTQDGLVAGEEYIIAIGNYAVANSAVENNEYVTAQYVVVNADGTITLPASVENKVLYQVGGSASGWTFYNASAGKYLGLNPDDSYWLTMMNSAWQWLYDGTDLDNQCTEYSNANSSGTAYYRYLFFDTNHEDFTTNIGTGHNVKFYRPVNNTPKHTVTWHYMDDSGNSTSTTSQVAEGSLPVAPDSIPTAYTAGGVTWELTGWTPAIVEMPVGADENTAYTADYTATSFTITWSYKNASGATVTDTTEVSTDTHPVPPAAPATYTLDGTKHTLVGWSDGNNRTTYPVGAELPYPTANTTYTAVYEDTEYTITWNYKNAAGTEIFRTTIVAPGEVPSFGTSNPPDYSADGDDYRFSRWDPTPAAATGPATYNAVYTSTTYTITWHYRNPDGTWHDPVITKVAEGLVPTHGTHPVWNDSATNIDYEFASWNSQEDGEGAAPVAAYANAEYWATYSKVGVYTYTMYLYAVYGRANTTGDTHIFWYANNGTADNHGGGVRQEDLELPINDNTPIPTPTSFSYEVPVRDGQTRTETGLAYVGHTFLGWARIRNIDDNDGMAHPELNSVDKCWLIWHEDANAEGGGYYTVNPDKNNEPSDLYVDPTLHISDVSADEMHPYHDLYAVWESHVFYVYHSNSGKLQAFDMPLNKATDAAAGSMIGDFDITALVEPGMLYGGYYKTYGGVQMDKLWEVAQTVGYSTWSEGTLVSSDWIQVGEIATKGNTSVNFQAYTGASLTSSENNNAYFWTRADAYNADTDEDVNGKTMKPVADTIYYLKEVPANKYLHSYYTYVLKFNEAGTHPSDPTDQIRVDELYMFTVVDDNNYKINGVRVGDTYARDPEDDTKTAALDASISRTAIAPRFTLVQDGNGTGTDGNPDAPITKTFVADNLIQQRGYLSIYHPTLPSGKVTMIPSWKTLDGVTIGNAPLDITVGDKTVTNSATTIPTNTKILYVNIAWHQSWWFNDGVNQTRANFHNTTTDEWNQKTMTQIPGTTYFYCEMPDNMTTVTIQRYNGNTWKSEGETITLNAEYNCVEQFGSTQGQTDQYVIWKNYIP